jgi:hypothetical protein
VPRCAGTVNYLNASGPVYIGDYGRKASSSTPDNPVTATENDGSGLKRLPLRVVTFNIAYALQIDEALAVLREETLLRRADVVTLQEMDAPGVDRIARDLGLNYVYFPSGVHPKFDRDFGCAVL